MAAWAAQTPQTSKNLQWPRSPDTIRFINNYSMEKLFSHGFPIRQEQITFSPLTNLPSLLPPVNQGLILWDHFLCLENAPVILDRSLV